jgi:hypothetical protein
MRIEPTTPWSLEAYTTRLLLQLIVMRVIISLYYALCTDSVQLAW